MSDYSNFTDVEIKYSPELKELYYLALFCLKHNEKDYIKNRPFETTALRHIRDRFMELVLFPIINYVPHPLAEVYNDHEVETKPDFTTFDIATIKADLASWGRVNQLKDSDFTDAFEAFKTELESGDTYTVDASKATAS